MAQSSKHTSQDIVQLASDVLRNERSSQIQRELAGSVLAQYHTEKHSGHDMQAKAAMVLKSKRYSETTKSLAGSVLAQAGGSK